VNKPIYAWEEKYRPLTVADTILPEPLKAKFQSYINAGDVPNLLLNGKPGLGKTTIARAMLQELNSDVYIINGSLDRNIDTLRHDIMQFASTVSLAGGRKYVIIDEADYLNPQSTQPALRTFMEDFKNNCGFILTCNWKNKIIEPLRDSRLAEIDFMIPKSLLPKMCMQFMKRVTAMLENEGITFEAAVLAKVITKYAPNWRKAIVELQAYATINKAIDVGMLASTNNESVHALIESMKEKNYTKVRQWAAENIDTTTIYRDLYDVADQYMESKYVPQFVITAAQYQHMATSCVDEEINTVGFLTEVMAEAIWV
jgi:DNA polymerase III delta prime subunit